MVLYMFFHNYCLCTFPCPGSRPSSTPILAGIHDYQQILNSRSTPTSRRVLSIPFSDTDRLQNFNVVIFEDPVPEGVEDLNITLSLSSDDMNLEGQVIVSPAVATVRIRDNDRKFDCFQYLLGDIMKKSSLLELP